MKVLLFCFSNTGNTRLVSDYVCRRLEGMGIETRLSDITLSREVVDLDRFDVIGFAFPVWTWGPPYLVLNLLQELPLQSQKPAFFLSTHAGISGGTDYIFSNALRERGFLVTSRQDLLAPTSEPVARRILSPALMYVDRQPGRRHKKRLDSFIDELASICREVGRGELPEEVRVRNNFYNPFSLVARLFDRESLPRAVGCPSLVDRSLCALCGRCAEVCPLGRVTVEDGEVRLTGSCAACYSCYNHCPNNAISARHTRGRQYKGPSRRFRNLMGAE